MKRCTEVGVVQNAQMCMGLKVEVGGPEPRTRTPQGPKRQFPNWEGAQNGMKIFVILQWWTTPPGEERLVWCKMPKCAWAWRWRWVDQNPGPEPPRAQRGNFPIGKVPKMEWKCFVVLGG